MQRPLRVWQPALVEPQPNWSRRVVSLLDAQSFLDPPKQNFCGGRYQTWANSHLLILGAPDLPRSNCLDVGQRYGAGQLWQVPAAPVHRLPEVPARADVLGRLGGWHHLHHII